jgi:MinD-like ATPase involved in chromosome partitioning or flagellar assembly
MYILAIANNKGAVGKTTVTQNNKIKGNYREGF